MRVRALVTPALLIWIAAAIWLLWGTPAAAGSKLVYVGLARDDLTGLTLSLQVKAKRSGVRLKGKLRCSPRAFCIKPKGRFVATVSPLGEVTGIAQFGSRGRCVFVGFEDMAQTTLDGDYACENRFGQLLSAGPFALDRIR